MQPYSAPSSPSSSSAHVNNYKRPLREPLLLCVPSSTVRALAVYVLSTHPDAMSALDWAIAILCKAGLLSPAKLDLCGNGAWHTVAVDDGAHCGFITTADGDGTGEGGVVTLLAGVINVAVGTDSLAEDEECLAGMDGGFRFGLDDGG